MNTHMTRNDYRHYGYDMDAQDEAWRMGYGKGRQDRTRSWAIAIAAFIVGADRRARHKIAAVATAIVITLCIFALAFKKEIAIVIGCFITYKIIRKLERTWTMHRPAKGVIVPADEEEQF